MFGGNQQPKTPAHQLGAIDPDQARSRKIYQLNGAISSEAIIADRSEIIEIRIFLPTLVDLGLGLFELLILQFQLDLMNL